MDSAERRSQRRWRIHDRRSWGSGDPRPPRPRRLGRADSNRLGCLVGTSEADSRLTATRYSSSASFFRDLTDARELAGTPPSAPLPFGASVWSTECFEQLRPIDRNLSDGEILSLGGWYLRVVWTPGYTPGHVTFFDATHGLLFTGDHVLPEISPHIAVLTPEAPDPLGDYLASLERVALLEVTEVLPAHRWCFTNRQERIDELRHHHALRLDEVRDLVRQQGSATTWSVAMGLAWTQSLIRALDLVQRLESSETWAHGTNLEERGDVRRMPGRPVRFDLR